MLFNTAGAQSQLVSNLIERGQQRLEEQGAVTAFLERQFALSGITSCGTSSASRSAPGTEGVLAPVGAALWEML